MKIDHQQRIVLELTIPEAVAVYSALCFPSMMRGLGLDVADISEGMSLQFGVCIDTVLMTELSDRIAESEFLDDYIMQD